MPHQLRVSLQGFSPGHPYPPFCLILPLARAKRYKLASALSRAAAENWREVPEILGGFDALAGYDHYPGAGRHSLKAGQSRGYGNRSRNPAGVPL